MNDETGQDGSSAPRFAARENGDASQVLPKLDVTLQLIADLNELAADAASIAELGREHFLHTVDGRLARHAADGLIIKVQEICDRLPTEVKARHPNIPWNAIRGVRNRLGHNYRATDYRIVWNSISVDIPAISGELNATGQEPPS